MRKTLVLLLAVLCCATVALAAPVSQKESRFLASRYLNMAIGMKKAPHLTLCKTYTDAEGQATLYVYNIADSGYILVSGDDLVTPILGYSFNGVFDEKRLAPNFSNWLSGKSNGIAAMRHAKYALRRASVADEREALLTSDVSFFSNKGTKDVPMLLQTRWGQGEGYNDMCPEYTGTGNSNGRAVVGCVALAMAQVIRYWAYPDTGFGSYSYYDAPYGIQTANFRTVRYDYANMPNSYYSWDDNDEQRAALSLLCYHCGVSVDMDYQSVNNVDGSGAYTPKVPKGLKNFGYLDAYYVSRGVSEDTRRMFDSLMLVDLNKRMPVVCSGHGNGYGHAFVCDGYRANTNKYHFNWGWNGYQDGYYTMDDMNGFSSSQGAVFNIHPSGFGTQNNPIYIASDGTGDGSSWNNASSNLQGAIDLSATFGPFPIWVKEGVYYGDTNGQNAITMRSGTELYGGFAGTETSQSEANGFEHPTVISGRGERRAFYCDNFPAMTKVSDMTFADGVADEGAGAYVQNKVTLFRCVVRNNVGNHGAGLFSTGGAFLNGVVAFMNKGADAVYINERDNLKNSLIAYNEGNGVVMAGTGAVLNCSVLSNSKYGIIPNSTTLIRNSIVCDNDSGALMGMCGKAAFSLFDYKAGMDAALDSLLLVNDNVLVDDISQVLFINARPRDALTEDLPDWHLTSASPCVNAGDTITSDVYRYDLDGGQRIRQGRVDMGCYESAYSGVGIGRREGDIFNVYPNPAMHNVTVCTTVPAKIAIFNATGQQVREVRSNGKVTIDISSLPQGVYFVRVGNGKMVKLVK
ncbi:MAG: thiol protease/hemagglutinin PrtT [Bacteroidales bacterium]|nr:thiol protease/hemagglutinin PrtT [Bacteroidales bacterium]